MSGSRGGDVALTITPRRSAVQPPLHSHRTVYVAPLPITPHAHNTHTHSSSSLPLPLLIHPSLLSSSSDVLSASLSPALLKHLVTQGHMSGSQTERGRGRGSGHPSHSRALTRPEDVLSTYSPRKKHHHVHSMQHMTGHTTPTHTFTATPSISHSPSVSTFSSPLLAPLSPALSNGTTPVVSPALAATRTPTYQRASLSNSFLSPTQHNHLTVLSHVRTSSNASSISPSQHSRSPSFAPSLPPAASTPLSPAFSSLIQDINRRDYHAIMETLKSEAQPESAATDAPVQIVKYLVPYRTRPDNPDTSPSPSTSRSPGSSSLQPPSISSSAAASRRRTNPKEANGLNAEAQRQLQHKQWRLERDQRRKQEQKEREREEAERKKKATLELKARQQREEEETRQRRYQEREEMRIAANLQRLKEEKIKQSHAARTEEMSSKHLERSMARSSVEYTATKSTTSHANHTAATANTVATTSPMTTSYTQYPSTHIHLNGKSESDRDTHGQVQLPLLSTSAIIKAAKAGNQQQMEVLIAQWRKSIAEEVERDFECRRKSTRRGKSSSTDASGSASASKSRAHSPTSASPAAPHKRSSTTLIVTADVATLSSSDDEHDGEDLAAAQNGELDLSHVKDSIRSSQTHKRTSHQHQTHAAQHKRKTVEFAQRPRSGAAARAASGDRSEVRAVRSKAGSRSGSRSASRASSPTRNVRASLSSNQPIHRSLQLPAGAAPQPDNTAAEQDAAAPATIVRSKDEEVSHRLGQWMNRRDKNGSTLLCHAVWKRRVNLLPYLLSQGCSVSVPDSLGNLPLHLACQRGSWEMVKLLLEAGAPLHAVNAQQKVCFDVAPDGSTGLQLATRTIEYIKKLPQLYSGEDVELVEQWSNRRALSMIHHENEALRRAEKEREEVDVALRSSSSKRTTATNGHTRHLSTGLASFRSNSRAASKRTTPVQTPSRSPSRPTTPLPARSGVSSPTEGLTATSYQHHRATSSNGSGNGLSVSPAPSRPTSSYRRDHHRKAKASHRSRRKGRVSRDNSISSNSATMPPFTATSQSQPAASESASATTTTQAQATPAPISASPVDPSSPSASPEASPMDGDQQDVDGAQTGQPTSNSQAAVSPIETTLSPAASDGSVDTTSPVVSPPLSHASQSSASAEQDTTPDGGSVGDASLASVSSIATLTATSRTLIMSPRSLAEVMSF